MRGRLRGALLALPLLIALGACGPFDQLPIVGKPQPPSHLAALDVKLAGTVYAVQGGRVWKLHGGRLDALTPDGQSYAYPAASADGQVTAAALIGKGHAEIAGGGRDFSSLTPLTHPAADPRLASIDIKPSLSADGMTLAFLSDRSSCTRGGGACPDETVWGGPLHGTARRLVAPTFAGGGADFPTFLPDGSAVLFVSWATGKSVVEQVTLRGAVSPLFTPEEGAVLDPVAGPGGRLAFARRKGTATDIGISDLSGAGAVSLTSFGDARQPAWAPDGQSLVFISAHGGSFDLWQVSLSGKDEPKRLSWGADLDANSRPIWIQG
jgi:Tol biopolymer transport system component